MTPDFSFVSDADTLPQQAGSSNGPPQAPPRIHVPSHKQVHSTEQQGGASTFSHLFQPKGLVRSFIQQQQQQAQQQHQAPQQQQARPPAAVDGGVLAPPPATAQQGSAAALQQPPQWHQQQDQHQRQQHPHQSQQLAFGGAAAPSFQAPPAPAPAQQHQQYQQQQQQQQQQYQQQQPTNAIVVSKRQAGNPILKHLRNVRWAWGDIAPDYLLGGAGCALFLSLRYHLLQPEYIMHRIKGVGRGAYALRVLLVWVDVEDAAQPLGEVTKAATLNEFTVVCGWSAEECARYLEVFKAFEHRPATAIQERQDSDYVSRVTGVLCAVRGINRTDALALCMSLGSLGAVLGATREQLSACPGIGPTKVARLMEAFGAFKRPASSVTAAKGQGAAAGSTPGQAAGAGPFVPAPQPQQQSQQEGEELGSTEATQAGSAQGGPASRDGALVHMATQMLTQAGAAARASVLDPEQDGGEGSDSAGEEDAGGEGG